MRKIQVPRYLLHSLVLLALIGGTTVLVGLGTYSRLIWKAANYNALKAEQSHLKRQYEQLQARVSGTDQRLSSLQSLATEVAMTYGITQFRTTPFAVEAAPPPREDPQSSYEQSVEQLQFLLRNAKAVTVSARGLRLTPTWTGLDGIEESTFIPSIWPVLGQISGSFGERLDPFHGEGAFHRGIDISAQYGDPVRASADGLVVRAGPQAGYGRMIEIDHGFGLTTYYGHLSGLNTFVGAQVKRGEVIGYIGSTGRSTGPHLHYEVRIYGAPVNPWRYMRGVRSGAAS